MSNDLFSNDADFAALSDEFEEFSLLEDEFGEEGMGALEALEQELASVPELNDEVGAMSIDMLTEDAQMEMQFLGGFLKRKVAKLLKKLVNLLRRHGAKLAHCVPVVTEAIRLFKKGKYIAALRKVYQAYKCIKKAI